MQLHSWCQINYEKFINFFKLRCHLDAEPSNQVNIFEMFKSNYTQIACILRVYSDLVDGQINDICVPLCPLECDSISYELSASFSRFPKRSYAKVSLINFTLF